MVKLKYGHVLSIRITKNFNIENKTKSITVYCKNMLSILPCMYVFLINIIIYRYHTIVTKIENPPIIFTFQRLTSGGNSSSLISLNLFFTVVEFNKTDVTVC
jgi:hypothetical protein